MRLTSYLIYLASKKVQHQQLLQYYNIIMELFQTLIAQVYSLQLLLDKSGNHHLIKQVFNNFKVKVERFHDNIAQFQLNIEDYESQSINHENIKHTLKLIRSRFMVYQYQFKVRFYLNVLNTGQVNQIKHFQIQTRYQDDYIQTLPPIIIPILKYYKRLQLSIFNDLTKKNYQTFKQNIEFPKSTTTVIAGVADILKGAMTQTDIANIPSQLFNKRISGIYTGYITVYSQVIYVLCTIDNKYNTTTQLSTSIPLTKMNVSVENQTGEYLFYPNEIIQGYYQYINQYIKLKRKDKQLKSYVDAKDLEIRQIIKKQYQLLEQRQKQNLLLNQRLNIYMQQQITEKTALNSEIDNKLKESERFNTKTMSNLNQIQTKQKQFFKKSQQNIQGIAVQLQKKVQSTNKIIQKAYQRNQSKFKQFEKDQENRQLYVSELNKLKDQLTQQTLQMKKRKQSLQEFRNNVTSQSVKRQNRMTQLINQVQNAGKGNSLRQQNQKKQIAQFKSTVFEMVAGYNRQSKDKIAQSKGLIQGISKQIDQKIIQTNNMLEKIRLIQSNTSTGLTNQYTKLDQFQKSITQIKQDTLTNSRIIDEATNHINSSVVQIYQGQAKLEQMVGVMLTMIRLQIRQDVQVSEKKVTTDFRGQLDLIKNQFKNQLDKMKKQSSKLTDKYLKGIQLELQSHAKTMFLDKVNTQNSIYDIYVKGNQLYKKVKTNQNNYRSDKFIYGANFNNLYTNQSILNNDVQIINKFIQNQRFLKTTQSNIQNRYYIDTSLNGLSTKIQQIKDAQLLKKDQYDKILRSIQKQLDK